MDLHAQISSGDFAQEGMTVIKTVEMHTGGEVSPNAAAHVHEWELQPRTQPTRIIVQGYPPLYGETLLEKRTYAREHLDHVRQWYSINCWIARGSVHADDGAA